MAADPRLSNSCTFGTTPLHLASRNGHFEGVCLLLDEGASVDAKDVGKRTPLHEASKNGQLEVVRLLIDKGARVDAETEAKDTPLQGVCQGYLQVARLLSTRAPGWTPRT